MSGQISNSAPSLDDIYYMTAHIYADKNLSRTATATFAHFAEVCGMLSIHARNKKREGFDVTDAICKALGWYFPLLAKMGVASVEELIFTKFPGVCPYCRKAPHVDAACKQVLGTQPTVDHAEVVRHFNANWQYRPKTLNQWQEMFQSIYPRTPDDRTKSVVGLLEELGELAEAVRVFEAHPKYFLGEAADAFSYLMGIANEHSLRLKQEQGVEFSLEEEYLKRFPGLCTQCGSKTCICPAVPLATVGRMAKEMDIVSGRMPFVDNLTAFEDRGSKIAREVLDRLGGYNGLTESLPLDRGDANRALVLLCLGIADAVEESHSIVADGLRAQAIRVSSEVQSPGTPRKSFDVRPVIRELESAWKNLEREQKEKIKSTSDLVGEFGAMLDTQRVLFVYSSPADETPLRVGAELRAVREVVELGDKKGIVIDDLPAATIDDLSQYMLRTRFNVLHFAGHSNSESLTFEDHRGSAVDVPLSAVSHLVSRYPSIECIVLNSCSSLEKIDSSIARFTIGMNDEIDDDEAIAFSKGFYAALAMHRTYPEAFEEGISRVKLAGFSGNQIRFLQS